MLSARELLEPDKCPVYSDLWLHENPIREWLSDCTAQYAVTNKDLRVAAGMGGRSERFSCAPGASGPSSTIGCERGNTMNYVLGSFVKRSCNSRRTLVIVFVLLLFCAVNALAQSLNWEGQTGAFVTPFAYTSPSSSNGFGHPTVAFHYLNGGSVIGNDFQASITVGFLKVGEVGYTRASSAAGNTAGLSPLFEGGYNTFHGKINFIPENAGKTKIIPALAAGFVVRTQVRRVGGVLQGSDTTNGDFYLVGTKTIPEIKGLPIVLNFGVKVTNASILGIAGNAPNWQGRLFGAAAFVLNGPAHSKLVLGSEFAQQPRSIENLPGATLPTTLTYFVRVLPPGEGRFNLDLGVAHVAGSIMPGVDLQARAQFAMGVSYRF